MVSEGVGVDCKTVCDEFAAAFREMIQVWICFSAYRTVFNEEYEMVFEVDYRTLFLYRTICEGSVFYPISEPLKRFCKTPFFFLSKRGVG